MRFTAFFRYHTTKGTTPAGAPNTTIGSDSAPSPTADGTVAPTYPPVQPTLADDNLLVVQNVSSQAGFPQKIAVGYGWVGAGAAPAVTASLYVLEEATGLWFLVAPATTTLTAGGLVFFDALCVPDGSPGGGGVPGGVPSYALGKASAQRYLLVPACASPTTGQFYFCMAPVMTASP